MVIRLEMSKVVKLIDAFTGKAVSGGKILLFGKSRFMDKGDGFYVAANLKSGLYSARVVIEGYYEKLVDIFVDGSDDCQVIMINSCKKSDVIRVPLAVNSVRSEMHKYTVLYSFDVADLRRVVTAKCEAIDAEIKLQNSVSLSLEGRKIGFDSGVVRQLGSYSFATEKYFIDSKFNEIIPLGSVCNLLIEAQSDENGLAILEIPSYMVQNDGVCLKVYFDGVIYKYALAKSEYLNLESERFDEKMLKLMLEGDF